MNAESSFGYVTEFVFLFPQLHNLGYLSTLFGFQRMSLKVALLNIQYLNFET
jgi:hypothetical protein